MWVCLRIGILFIALAVRATFSCFDIFVAVGRVDNRPKKVKFSVGVCCFTKLCGGSIQAIRG